MSEPRKYYVVFSFFVLTKPKCLIFDGVMLSLVLFICFRCLYFFSSDVTTLSSNIDGPVMSSAFLLREFN